MGRAWHAFFPRFYRLLRIGEPLLHRRLLRRGIGNTVALTVRGRRSGVSRTVLLGLLAVGGERYLGHPDGTCAWTLNLEAAGEGTMTIPGRAVVRVVPALLHPGIERDRVVRATFRQHPFPGNVIYRLARDHVRDVGRFYRLHVAEAPGADVPTPPPPPDPR